MKTPSLNERMMTECPSWSVEKTLATTPERMAVIGLPADPVVNPQSEPR